MSNLPVLKPREVIRILETLGFVEVRQRGTTVPFHARRDIAPPLLRQIAKDIGMNAQEFISHR